MELLKISTHATDLVTTQENGCCDMPGAVGSSFNTSTCGDDKLSSTVTRHLNGH